jgi:hypothetical protein
VACSVSTTLGTCQPSPEVVYGVVHPCTSNTFQGKVFEGIYLKNGCSTRLYACSANPATSAASQTSKRPRDSFSCGNRNPAHPFSSTM